MALIPFLDRARLYHRNDHDHDAPDTAAMNDLFNDHPKEQSRA